VGTEEQGGIEAWEKGATLPGGDGMKRGKERHCRYY